MTLRELRAMPMFKDVPGDVLKTVLPVLREESFKAGETVFSEDSVSDRLYMIKKGEVQIRKATHKQRGRHKLIAVLKGGEFFGEMAVFLGQPRTADAIARTDAVLISMSRDELSDMLGRSPEAAFKVMGFFTSTLTERLRATTDELVTVYEIGRLVTAARDVDELADCVLDGLMRAVKGSDAGLLAAWNEFNEEYSVLASKGMKLQGKPPALAGDDLLVSWMTENMEPILSADMKKDGRPMVVKAGGIWGFRSLVAAPFVVQGKLLGLIALGNKKTANAFSYNHMVLASAVSSYAAVAFENMRFARAETDLARLNQSKSTIQPFVR